MKCDHCTRKECSKKTKTDDQENAAVNVWSRAQENGEKGEFHKVADARIFLSDCLVCDSCVTAEEGVQVSQQNTKDFFHVLNLNKKCDPHSTRCWQCPCVLSLCFILLLNSTSVSLMHPEGSEAFSKALGCTVFDMMIAADISILESQKEFVRRYCQHHEEEPWLPMLTSACPGWVTPTPHLCTAKSPQQIIGSPMKDYFTRRQNLSPDKIFHVIVAPCYDKKLEGLLEDVPTAVYSSLGAACVLTSGETVQIMEQSDLASHDAAMDTVWRHEEGGGEAPRGCQLRRVPGTHLHAHGQGAVQGGCGVLTYCTLRNKDLQEVTLERDGEILLRFEAAYGFRNIQKWS